MNQMIPGGIQASASTSGYTLLRDTGGAVGEFALWVREETLDLPGRLQAYAKLLQALAQESNAKLLVVTGESLQPRVAPWLAGLAPGRFDILAIPDSDFEHSEVWPRDAMLCATDTQGKQCFAHPHVGFLGNLAYWLANECQADLIELGIWLDGGDSLVVDDDKWVVGAAAIRNSLRYRVAPDWNSAVASFGAAVGRQPPVIAGYDPKDISVMGRLKDAKARVYRQFKKDHKSHPLIAHCASTLIAIWDVVRNIADPNALESAWSHIDMVVSVTGVVCEDSNKPLVLVADTRGVGCPNGKRAQQKGDRLDSLQRVLERGGFAVKRNPAPCIGQDILGCNNTIVQRAVDANGDRADTVWLPVFADDGPNKSLAAADAENIRIWRDVLKFKTVVPVPGWRAFNEGCIRCATLPLSRAP